MGRLGETLENTTEIHLENDWITLLFLDPFIHKVSNGYFGSHVIELNDATLIFYSEEFGGYVGKNFHKHT